MNFQQLVLALQSFWSQQGCVIGQPYDVEKGAGTFNPHTFLRTLGPEPWNVAYIEPCRRPTDGRYGENPNRLGAYYQFQVILKPSPKDVLDRYLRGLTALGIRPKEHDIRFVEDDWESPTLGAWGLGWEVWLDGMEISQFTYFQQVGGIECRPVAAEITYGLERIAMYLQGVDSIFDLEWGGGFSYREIHHMTEVEWSKYNFEHADPTLLFQQFRMCEEESRRLADLGLVFPAYDFACRASHTFNTLDARGAISVAERQAYIGRIRTLARRCAETWVREREKLGWPILQRSRPPAQASDETIVEPMSFLEDMGSEGTVTLPVAPAITTQELLLEIGCEEVPAGFLDGAIAGLRAAVVSLLDGRGIGHGAARVATTPRRLVLVIDAVEPVAGVREELVLGPPVKAAIAEDGSPRVPALKFAEGHGVSVSALMRTTTVKGEYLAVRRLAGGENTLTVLEEGLPEILGNLPWKKSMRWADRDERFARPVHWIVATLGSNQVRFRFAGIRSGNRSWGHRFFGNESFEVEGWQSLEDGLRDRYVVLDNTTRRERILAGLRTGAAALAGTPQIDEDLLDVVVGLVESPRVVAGRFEDRHLALPPFMSGTVLAHHQKVVPVRGADGSLLPWFLGVSNNPTAEQPLVIKGYEKVVAARLADGAFFWEKDRKRRLEEFRDDARGITFLEGMGTVLDKSIRIEALARSIASRVGPRVADTAARAGRLCKADLSTAVVREFPELQGEMGRTYARLDGEGDAVAEAIFEHYQPRNSEDAVAPSLAGACVALADKLDTLVVCFRIGKTPTGSADPFGLRRAAIGVLRTVQQHGLTIPLSEWVAAAVEGCPAPAKGGQSSEATSRAVLDFLRGRLAANLVGEGHATEMVEAVLQAGFEDVGDARARLEAITRLRGSEEWADLLASWKRMAHIVRKAPEEDRRGAVEIELLVEPEERALWVACSTHWGADWRISGNYPAEVRKMASLRAPLAAFFDKVMVMAKEDDLRRNRLGLLSSICALFERVAVFGGPS